MWATSPSTTRAAFAPQWRRQACARGEALPGAAAGALSMPRLERMHTLSCPCGYAAHPACRCVLSASLDDDVWEWVTGLGRRVGARDRERCVCARKDRAAAALGLHQCVEVTI